jgi:hypothetical protein
MMMEGNARRSRRWPRHKSQGPLSFLLWQKTEGGTTRAMSLKEASIEARVDAMHVRPPDGLLRAAAAWLVVGGASSSAASSSSSSRQINNGRTERPLQKRVSGGCPEPRLDSRGKAALESSAVKETIDRTSVGAGGVRSNPSRETTHTHTTQSTCVWPAHAPLLYFRFRGSNIMINGIPATENLEERCSSEV